jgi:hypothetical protein
LAGQYGVGSGVDASARSGDTAPDTEDAKASLGHWLADTGVADMILWLRARPLTDIVGGDIVVTGYGPVEYFLVAPYAFAGDVDSVNAATRRLEAAMRSLQGE